MSYITKKSFKAISNILPVVLIGLFAAAFVAGCSNDDNPVNNNPNSPSKVQGRATDNSGFQKATGTQSSIEGATVILARVKADGTLETVSNASVQTDANGQFTVETDVDGESNLEVVATKGSNTWKAVVSATVKNGITVYAPPMNDETTVEADVYANIKASGNTNVSFADIAANINSNVAAQVKGNATAISELAASIKAEIEAKEKAFMSAEIGGTQANWQAIVNANIQAQAQLERDLFVASSQADIDAAFESKANATINAYKNAGFDVSVYGKVFEPASRVFINSAASISASAKFAAEQRIAKLRAKIINFIVQAKFTAMGAAQAQMDAVISAATTLNASIDAATTSSEIVTAFDNYHTAVVNQLKITLNVDDATMATLESNIAGFKATLKSSASASASTEVVVNAYMKFYSDIKTSTESVLSSATQAQITATAQLLIMLNAQF